MLTRKSASSYFDVLPKQQQQSRYNHQRFNALIGMACEAFVFRWASGNESKQNTTGRCRRELNKVDDEQRWRSLELMETKARHMHEGKNGRPNDGSHDNAWIKIFFFVILVNLRDTRHIKCKKIEKTDKQKKEKEIVSCSSIKVFNNISFICTVCYEIMRLCVRCTELATLAEFTNNAHSSNGETQRFILYKNIDGFCSIASSDCWVLQDN